MEEILKRNQILEKHPSLLQRIIKAIQDYRMIEKKDKILVAVSGGKDSLCMMHLLDYLCKKKIFDFKMMVANIDLGYGCANKEILKQHFQTFKIDYLFLEIDILKDKSRKDVSCFWCAWNRRKALFEIAKEYSCKKVALGHHLDDIVYTALLNLVFHGEISTSPAYLKMFGGEIILIRPLCYIQEKETIWLAKVLGLPLPCCACPQKPTSKRTRIKEIFLRLFKDYPSTKNNVFDALRRQNLSPYYGEEIYSTSLYYRNSRPSY